MAVEESRMAVKPNNELRKLPAVDRLLAVPDLVQAASHYGHELAVEHVRAALEAAREAILRGEPCPEEAHLVARALRGLQETVQPTLRPVINATGVILHTNLGRAPLSDAAMEAMRRAGEGYSNLEFDLDEGQRGSRYVHAESLLCRLTGAEAALLVNNNAGAVLLVLSALARGREVIISRGQLVEIGGGFRIPDVMAQSGARLVEVGTTNRTYIEDYEAAISETSAGGDARDQAAPREATSGEGTVALLRVHSSNFRVTGFTHQPTLAQMAGLAHDRGLLLIDDLGSGTLIDTQPFGLEHEPTVQESLAAGADVVTFSGDKLLGGPQAGIIVGRAQLIARLRRFPLTRALRVDKTTIAGVQANLLHYVKNEAVTQIPIWRMIAASPEDIAERAQALRQALGAAGDRCDLVVGRSMVGGGSLPEESLPTTLLALPSEVSVSLVAKLRTGEPAILARLQDGRLVIDLRTVLPRQEGAMLQRLRELLR